MAITKPPVLPAWADAGDKVQPSNAELSVGWPVSSTPPSRQRFNWVLNYVANAVRYFSRRGMPDYDAAETYMTGDRIIGDDGKTYRSLIDNNTAQTPSTSPTKWERWGFTLAQLNAEMTTPAKFDNTTKAATTAFVQGVGLHSNGVNGTAANYVMTVADIGRCYYSVGINANITLPPILSVPSGSIVNILNINGSPCVISGDANIYAVGAVATSITIGQWENLTLVSNGVTWFQMAGSSGLGVGQSWLNVLAGRVLGTTYTNASGKPITVNVSVTMVNPNTLITVSIGGSGLTVSTGSVAGYVTGGNFIVPPGVTYIVTAVGTLTSWLELR